MDGIQERVSTCAKDLHEIGDDVATLNSRLTGLRALLFKAEILRARRQVKSASESDDAPAGEAGKRSSRSPSKGRDGNDGDDVDQLTQSVRDLDFSRKEEARLEMYKYRGKAKKSAQDRLLGSLAGLTDIRFRRWSEDRGVEVPRSGRVKCSKSPASSVPSHAPPILGERPPLPPLGNLSDVPSLEISADRLTSKDQKTLLEELRRVRKLLSKESSPPINEIVQSGAVPYLVHLLLHDNPSIQFEAAWALTNIASGTSEQTQTVITNGGVPCFVYLLRSPVPEVCDQAIWALGNISGDCIQYRDLCLHHNIVPVVINIIRSSEKISLVRNAVWCMSNLCRGKPKPDFESVRVAIPTLARCAMSPDTQAKVDALWALSYLSDGSNEKIGCVLDHIDLPMLVGHVNAGDLEVRTPALRTLGNIVTGDDQQTQACIEAGLIPALKTVLENHHARATLLREACWALSNITAGTQEQIQVVIDAGLVPILARFAHQAEPRVAKEATWALSNATSGGTPQQLHALIQADVVQALQRMLDAAVQRGDNLRQVVLEGLQNLATRVHSLQAVKRLYDFMNDCGLVEDLAERFEEDPHVDRIFEIFEEHDLL